MEESVFSSVYEHAPVPILIVDEDVRIRSANRSALDLLAKPLDDALGVRAGEVFGCLNSYDDPRGCGTGPECKECKIRGSVNKTMATGKEIRRIEATVPVSVGDRQAIVSLLVSTSRIPWEKQQRVLLCLENITDLKAAQEALRRSNEHMKFLSSILRHDIRGNLGIVSASIEIVKEEHEKTIDRDALARLDKAVAIIQKSADLLDHMKDLEKAVSSERSLKPVDLRRIIESALVKSDLKATVKGEGWALADDALVSAIDNIVMNAAQHGKAQRIEFTISEGDRWIVLRIADDGIGVPKDLRDKVFEKGFTTAGAGHHGLGLYIAKAVVEMCNGSIRIEDNEPKGTAFVIELRKPKKTKR